MRQAVIAMMLLFVPFVRAAEPQSRGAVVDEMIAALDAVTTFSSVTISPDGSRIAYIERGAAGPQILVTGVSGGAAVRLAPAKAGDSRPSGLAWSTDGKEVAFIANSGGAQAVFVASSDGKSVRQLTTTTGAYEGVKWSPDGKKISVLLVENATRRTGAAAAIPMPTGEVDAKSAIEEQRIGVVDVATKKLELVSPEDMYVYDYDWSPDSKSFVAEAAHGTGEANYWIAQLYRIDVGAAPRMLYRPKLQLANPRWSPDGKSIAFIEGLMSDEGSNGGDLFVIPANGGEARNLTQGLPATVTSFEWAPEARSLVAAEQIYGMSGFARISEKGVEQLWSGDEKVSTSWSVGASFARDRVTTAVTRQSYASPPEIWAGSIGEWKRVTNRNAAVKPLWGGATSVTFTNDGFREQGWLLAPRNADASKRAPMVVQVHGGPSAGFVPSWPGLETAVLAASGYYVFMPNPRGSYGQGEAFTQANVKDFGYGDLRDILAGTDAAIAGAAIDKDRVGIWGWSYGGFMTMWAVTQTQRFRAAVAGAGIANWQSYYGQNAISEWMIPFFGASVYADPFIYRRSSPIEFIQQAKTPTLVLAGEKDGEVPAPQSFEFYRALKSLGVKTKLVVYPNEGHRFAKPEHDRDKAKRVVEWFDENL